MAALTACAVVAAPAGAKDKGIYVDPDSPTGKEYAIPIDSARHAAAGTANARGARQGGTDAVPFGEGVGDDRAGGSSKSSSHSHTNGTRHVLATLPREELVTAARPVKTGGIGSDVAVMAIAALVLVLGIALGLVLRRRSTSA